MIRYLDSFLGGFCGITTVFITLKLFNIITWSWWWILAPLYIPVGIVVILLGIVLLTVILTEDFID